MAKVEIVKRVIDAMYQASGYDIDPICTLLNNNGQYTCEGVSAGHKWEYNGKPFLLEVDDPSNIKVKLKGKDIFTHPRVYMSNNANPEAYISKKHPQKEFWLFYGWTGDKHNAEILNSLCENFKQKTGYIGDLLNDDDYQKLITSRNAKNNSNNVETRVADSDNIDAKSSVNSSFNSDNVHATIPLNQILFGPPGTGKTYHAINKALEILEPNFTCTEENREEAVQKFNKHKEEGRIVFTTFHQSMNYEDFIEGIKPETHDGNIVYEVEDGIFCRMAKRAYADIIDMPTGKKNLVTFRHKFDNFINYVTEMLNNGQLVEYKSKTDKVQQVAKVDNDTIRFYRAKGENDIDVNTVTYDRLQKLDDAKYDPNGEGKISSEIKNIIGGCNTTYFWTILNEIYKYNENNPTPLSKEICDRSIEDISFEYDRALKGNSPIKDTAKPYILIIDEINRGNIANIFGELITLIEEDKRLGNSEAMTCTLPYSKEEFGVPKNLYIIGTMNTADRSVEALDSALRRRFSFVEMMPNPELLKDVSIEGFTNTTLKDLLEIINKRIEVLKDREHQIGHSYFMKFAGKDFVEANALKEVFTDKIIPLLQEYFYGDYEKIQLVLGNGFVEEDKNDVCFAGKALYDDIPEKRYKIVEPKDMRQALAKLLNISLTQEGGGTSNQMENTGKTQ